MVVDTEYENKPENWINSRTPNTAELARLLLKAKGVHRNMTEFAEECGTSVSTFSRISNCKIKQAVPIELLVKIAEHADPDSGVEAYHLFHANGMITKMFVERKQQWSNDFERDEELFSRENDVKNILISDLVDRGNQIQLCNRIDDENASKYVKSTGRNGLILRVNGCEAKYWKFRVVNPIGIVRGDDAGARINYTVEANILLSRVAEIFLEDVWNPNKMEMCKVSFVFIVPEFYAEFNKIVSDKKFNNWFSTILIDITKREVEEEFIFERIDGKKLKSPLAYQVLSHNNDDDEEYMGMSLEER